MNKILTKMRSNVLIPIKTIKEAFKTFYSQPKYLLLSSFCDITFLFLYGFMTAPLVKKIIENMLLVSQNLSGSADILAARNSVLQIILFLAGYILVTCWLYIFFQGTSWWCAHKSLGDHDKSRKLLEQLNDFIKKFAKTNLLWYSLFVVLNLVSYSSTIFIMFAEKTKTVPKNYFIITLFAVLFYFAFNSYALLGSRNTAGNAVSAKESIKKSFSIGIRQAPYALFSYLIIILFLLGLGYVIQFLFMLKLSLVAFIVGFLVVFPLFFFLRIFLTKTFSNFNKI